MNSIIETLSSSRKGIEDVLVSMIPHIVMFVTGFLTSVFIARGLGPKGMGSYALILSVSGLASALSDLGIGQTAIRFASQAVAQNNLSLQFSILRWAFRVRMVMVFLVSIAILTISSLITVKFWKAPELTFLLRVSLLIGVVSAVSAIPTIYFQSLKRFKMNSAVLVFQTLISFLGIVLLATYKIWTLEMVLGVNIISVSVSAIVFIILVPKDSFYANVDFFKAKGSLLEKLFKPPPYHQEIKSSLDSTNVSTFTFYMMISSFLVTLSMRADIWLMGYYLDKSQIGLYSVATRYTLPLVVILGALNTTLWPRVSALTSLARTKEIIKKTFQISILIAGFSVIYSILIPLTMPYVFGSKYNDGVLIGQLLCLRYSISILICPLGVVAYSLGFVKIFWWINLIQLLIIVVGNTILLKSMGILAAGLSLLLMELFGAVSMMTILWKKYRILQVT